jgi:hypothetical protein
VSRFDAYLIGVFVGMLLERHALAVRQRDELRRRCITLGGSVVTTSHDGGVW